MKTDRPVWYLRKRNPLRRLCSGRLHRWLARWVLGRGQDSTPWPGWPVSRLILARYVLENCSSPYTDRVTTDTITWRYAGARSARGDGGRRAVGRYGDEVRAKCVVVADTFVALKGLARAVREAWGGKIAGVTGSVGKTTTKEILAALLGARFRVLKSEGNFNNEYGLPLTLFHLDKTHQAAVLEMGMSRSGELSRLAEIARPDVGVVTRVAPAPLGIFRVRGRNCAGQARADRGAEWPRIRGGVERGRSTGGGVCVARSGARAARTDSRTRRISARKPLKIAARWGPRLSSFRATSACGWNCARWPPCHFECACGTGGSQRLGHRRSGSTGRATRSSCARHARRVAAVHEWSGADQR